MIETTVAEVVTLARTYADERVVGYISDDEAGDIVREEWCATIWPRIVQRADSWFATTSTSGVTSGVGTVGTPTDLHRAKRLILVWGDTEREDVNPLVERERATIEGTPWSRYGPKRYVLQGSTCRIYPLPAETVTAQWVYLPSPSGTDTIKGPESVKKVTALAAAIVMRDMQGEDASGLERRYGMALSDLDRQASAHYHDQAPRVIDVAPECGQLNNPDYHLPRA